MKNTLHPILKTAMLFLIPTLNFAQAPSLGTLLILLSFLQMEQ